MTVDAEFPTRILQALSQIETPITGLTSNFETLSLPVAQTAEFLGLPHEDLAALDICQDKYKQRIASGGGAVKIRKGDEVANVVKDALNYPVIVKPLGGIFSEGVSRANCASELSTAADRLFTSTYGVTGGGIKVATVEEYIDGPEIDVNVVLLDGEMLFAEIADDFPKAGDSGNSTSFKETAMVYPSGLPSDELDEIKGSIFRLLTSMGLRNGIYHVEARVKNSRMKYVEFDGITDLQPQEGASEKVESFLIEINPRLPGAMVKAAVRLTYGIDYDALHLLISLRDKQRVKAFAQPFSNGAQFWSMLIYISPDQGGQYQSSDIEEELRSQFPDLAKCVLFSITYFRRGDIIPSPTPDNQVSIAKLLIISRQSRKDLLEKAKEIKAKVNHEII